jgi:hypothetical protein
MPPDPAEPPEPALPPVLLVSLPPQPTVTAKNRARNEYFIEGRLQREGESVKST